MSDFENKNRSFAEESVDDILAGILNPDGTFNDDFNGLLKKYVGGDPQGSVVPVADISDRRDELAAAIRVEYEEKTDISFEEASKSVEERIEDKIPEIARDLYLRASEEAQRPEFTSTGDVKYPTMGVGAAEERVIFDADWEETAKKEAARLERVRQDRMLRGDSAYARTFIHSGAYMQNRSPYVDGTDVNTSYIDPVSDDDDFEGIAMGSQYYSSSKKPFFPEGFSVAQRNNSASGGKTERNRSGSSAYLRKDAPRQSDISWLQVDEKPAKKKKGLFGKKNTDSVTSAIRPSVEELLKEKEAAAAVNENAAAEENTAVPVIISEEAISQAEKETQGLRSTVAEIVDKYNRRSEEDERRRLEEQTRLEEERREKELRERRRLEEIRSIKEEISPEVFSAVEEDVSDGFDDYDDFSTEPAQKNEAPAKKSFGVVFDPTAFEDKKQTVSEFLEKISFDEVYAQPDESVTEEDTSEREKTKKKPSKSKRRKDS